MELGVDIGRGDEAARAGARREGAAGAAVLSGELRADSMRTVPVGTYAYAIITYAMASRASPLYY